ncbi:hypothetical protein BASA81_008418 [Batrachochytrium salamandrivorans]|nr:hypothetical protein BASA81_008418 [Batrachochytrium salamandrivorans]
MEDALQLRFAETEARIGVKVDEFERQLNWTQRLMGEIQYEMDVRKRPRKDKEAAAMAATPELEVATTLEPEAAATPEPEVAATAEPRVVVAVEQRPATPPIATQPPATKEEAWIKPLKQPDHSNNTVAVPPPYCHDGPNNLLYLPPMPGLWPVVHTAPVHQMFAMDASELP